MADYYVLVGRRFSDHAPARDVRAGAPEERRRAPRPTTASSGSSTSPPNKYDLIITDINMPIMDGLKLIKRVRTDERHKNVPIIVISTENSVEDRQRAMTLGATAYITKPIQAPQVIAKVKELLKIQ